MTLYVLIQRGLKPSELPELNQLAISIAELRSFDGQRFVRRVKGEDSSISHPEMSCLGLIQAGGEVSYLNGFRDWWHQQSGTNLEICEVSADKLNGSRRGTIAEWIANRLASVIAGLAQQSGSALEQNRQLRRSYGALQTAFRELEHFVSHNRLSMPILQYQTDTISSYWRPDLNGGKLTQLLPVLSTRFSFLELYFRKELARGDGELELMLELQPAGNILGSWKIKFADVRPGWNSFPPTPVIDEPNEVVLHCSWSSGIGAPAIGLTSPHWDRSFSAVSTADGLSRSVAMRVWSGLPGVNPPMLLNSPRVGQPRQPLSFPPDDLRNATQYRFDATVQRDYPSVAFLEESGRLLVHPHETIPTIATLPSELPVGVTVVSADVRAAKEDAPPIGYAMAVLPSTVVPEAVFLESSGAAFGFTGWHLLPPGQARRLRVVLGAPAEGGDRLFVASRLFEGSNESNAWATWGGFELSLDTELSFSRERVALKSHNVENERDPRADNKSALHTSGLPPGLEASSVPVIDRGEIRSFISPNADDQQQRILHSGWHTPESHAVWGSGIESRLVFRASDAIPTPLRVELDLAVCAPKSVDPTKVDICVNEDLISEIMFDTPEVKRVELLLSTVPPSRIVNILIRCLRPVKPIAVGLGVDERTLGIRLERLAITAAKTERPTSARDRQLSRRKSSGGG